MSRPKRPTPWAAKQARSRHVVEAVVPALACALGAAFAAFMIWTAGEVTIFTCQFRGSLSECVVQSSKLGLFESSRKVIVGVEGADVRAEPYEAEDDEGRKVTRIAYALALLDAGGRDLDQIPLQEDQALRRSQSWIRQLQRSDGAPRDRFVRFWITNPLAIGFGALLWVAMTCGALSLMFRHRRWARRALFAVALIQLVAAGLLIGVLATREAPPNGWPGLAAPSLLPDPEP